ncbi:MAG TPA: ATP-binding cassette domain-containing protein, partial [Solirubrobacterales bacterium]|nr:ATP-binding cassette domain-containing protein [Solirubrobacterales bacterium]
MRAEAKGFAVASPSPAGAGSPGAGVEIRGLRHSYGELRTIERLDLAAPEHGVLGLVGPSGCGKSTLLELIAGLQEPGEGEIEVGGAREARGRLGHCAFMPQRDLLLPWLTAIDNAALALRNRGARRGAARREAGRLFERFGLGGFEAARPAELSGG